MKGSSTDLSILVLCSTKDIVLEHSSLPLHRTWKYKMNKLFLTKWICRLHKQTLPPAIQNFSDIT